MENVIATREEVLHFISIQQRICGHGYGDGYGLDSGSGYGSNYGSISAHESINGYGFGDGYGSGFGYGEGYGEGYGDCNGFGSGSDYGYFDGDGRGHSKGFGYGTGYGYGSGLENIKAFNGNIVDYIDRVPTIITQVRDNIACGYIIKEDLTLSPCFIAKAGNFFAHGKTLKEAVSDVNAKEMKRLPLEERIEQFIEVFGSLDSEHTGKEFYDWHHILTGSCKMGRDEFCKFHDIDLEKKYTVRYFIDITKESYGRDVIHKVYEYYKR